MTLVWLVLVGLALGSALLSHAQLGRLPALPMTVGPEMTVRATGAAQALEKKSTSPERQDRIVALHGHALDELRDLRAALLGLDFTREQALEPAPESDDPSAIAGLEVSYQIVRPVHRFNVLLQGDSVEPTGLPPGVEPTDMLVELDGRPMRPAIGPEGLRSIISSRPEAFLVFERKNAVFTGRLSLPQPQAPLEIMGAFGLAVLLVLAMWRFHHSSLSEYTPLAVGFETIAFAWVSVIVFEYQWVLADYTLAYLTIVALVLMRPVGIFARTATAEGVAPRTWGVVVLGVLAAGMVCALLARGTIADAELALQLAAMISGFFVVFEIVLTGLNEESGKLLGERSIYLAGIILFVLLASVISWGMDDQAFREDRWRWFAAAVLALVWFGDILLCLRGLPGTPFEEVADEARRREVIWAYLAELSASFEGLGFELALLRGGQGVALRMTERELRAQPLEGAMLDALSIMLQEDARIPSSPLGDAKTDPMSGIAQALRIGLALRLSSPRQALDVLELEVIVLGRYDGELEPGVGDADLDFVQQRMGAVAWTACVIEGLRLLGTGQDAGAAPGPKPSQASWRDAAAAAPQPEVASSLSEAEAQQLKRALQGAAQAQRELERTLHLTRALYRPAPALPQGALERLVEPELVEALRFVLRQEGPVILAGALGTGKTFVARLAHALDEARQGSPCLILDVTDYEEDEALASALLGHATQAQRASSQDASFEDAPEDAPGDAPGDEEARPGDGGESGEQEERLGVLALCLGGSLIVRHAHLMPAPLWEALIEEADAAGVRLFLVASIEDAEQRSALEGLPQGLAQALASREIVLPALSRRDAIKRAALEELLFEAAIVHQRQLRGFSPAALSALMAYSFPGQLIEARAMLDVAARVARGPLVEISELPREVRRA